MFASITVVHLLIKDKASTSHPSPDDGELSLASGFRPRLSHEREKLKRTRHYCTPTAAIMTRCMHIFMMQRGLEGAEQMQTDRANSVEQLIDG